MNLDIHHLARVEGHGDIHVRIEEGKLKEARWSIVETPRFFEVMLKGQSIEQAHIFTSRICGICSISHALASLRAIENGLGITPPATAQNLRMLAMHGEALQSHSLHLFFLGLPDFYNEPSALPLLKTHPELYSAALRIRGCSNAICDAIAGRTTHPVSFCVGGVRKIPDAKTLLSLKDNLTSIIPALVEAAGFFEKLEIPEFHRVTEFVSLKGESAYPLIGGKLISSDGVEKAETEYLAMTNEYTVDFSNSKHAKLSRDSFAVGPLARINNNYHLLHPAAKDIAELFGLKPLNFNPFMNHIARLVECFHLTHSSLDIIEELLDSKDKTARTDYSLKESDGVGAVEAPRGILYHHYAMSRNGKIEKANCIIPTTQNNANIHIDLSHLVQQELASGKSDQEIAKLCEMLVRSYDPCISCSVH